MSAPAMPATTCPTWCDQDHAVDWTDHLSMTQHPEHPEQDWEPPHAGLVGYDLGGTFRDLMFSQEGDGPTSLLDEKGNEITVEELTEAVAQMQKALEVMRAASGAAQVLAR